MNKDQHNDEHKSKERQTNIKRMTTHKKGRVMVKGVYTPGFFSHLGVQSKHGRGVPALAPNELKFNSDATAEHAHLFSSFFGHGVTVLGLTGLRRRRAQPNPPF